MSNDDGGSAFPGLHPSKECLYQASGMSLRDYFAAKSMFAYQIGIATNTSILNAMVNEGKVAGRSASEQIAHSSYCMADAMLKERAK